MADRAVLINGLPASGKTTLGVALAAEIGGGVVLDAIWLSTRDRPFLETGLGRIGKPRVAEVWCDIPEALAHERFDERKPSRHEMHEAWRPGYWIGAGPVTQSPLRVDTTRPVDAAALAERVRAALAG